MEMKKSACEELKLKFKDIGVKLLLREQDLEEEEDDEDDDDDDEEEDEEEPDQDRIDALKAIIEEESGKKVE